MSLSASRAHERPARGWRVALGVLVLAALGLRLVGLDFLLPARMEGDGGVLVRQVELIESDAAEPWRDFCWSYYPHLVAHVVAATSDADEVQPGETDPLARHLAWAAAPSLRVRLVVVLWSLLLVPASWWLVRRFASDAAAFLAAASVAASPLLLVSAQEARPHAPAAACAALALVAALRLRASPSLGNYLLAALAALGAIATLQSGLAALLPLAAAHFLRERADPRAALGSGTPAPERSAWIGPLALLLAAALAVALFYPRSGGAAPSDDAPEIALRPDGEVDFFGHIVFLSAFNGQGFARIAQVLLSFEPALLACALAGLALWFAGRRPGAQRFPGAERFLGARRLSGAAWVVLAYAVPYCVVFGLYERTYERFVLQLLPPLACLAAFALDRFLGRPLHPGKLLVAALALLALPLATSLATARLRAGDDTADQVSAWIAAHAPREKLVLIPFVDLPLVRTPAAVDELQRIGWRSPWMAHQRSHPAQLPPAPRYELATLPLGRQRLRAEVEADALGVLRATGAKHFVLPVVSSLSGLESFRALRRALAEHGTLLARFPADATATVERAPVDALDSDEWQRRNWTIAFLSGEFTAGETLEVWRVD